VIVVTVDLWPYGDAKRAKRLGRAYVWNDGTGTLSRGNYRGRLQGKIETRQLTADLRVEDFPRKRLDVWDLLFRALRSSARLQRRNPGQEARRAVERPAPRTALAG
jgi:hypothetical protein